GLKYVHNDTCYPAQVVIGQLIDAIENGGYDKHNIALMITQTGGGCRASNYISLLRKALKNAGYDYIPVLSLNVSGLDECAMPLSLPMLIRAGYAIMFGDLIMCLKNQCLPYETEPVTEEISESFTRKVTDILTEKHINIIKIKKLYIEIIEKFKSIKLNKTKKLKVGIVGEIFVKFSPLGNNGLEKLLVENNGEVVMGGLLDFCMYCIYNSVIDTKLYGINKFKSVFYKIAYKFVLSRQKYLINIIKKHSDFNPPSYFADTVKAVKGYISLGVKMGEGWLLTAEMLELIHQGVKCIVCTQPFGCLPNHIVGKGMIKVIKENNPDVNIVPIDYDASASKVNQENRIKLMMAVGREKAMV
ncbi:MAG: 2-hydroxyacyl-CoA dehydratase, partial [Clostridia bacterium]|nr:2-hydroxyacyl-CoA dehydratase [Clostridia bacterium]